MVFTHKHDLQKYGDIVTKKYSVFDIQYHKACNHYDIIAKWFGVSERYIT